MRAHPAPASAGAGKGGGHFYREILPFTMGLQNRGELYITMEHKNSQDFLSPGFWLSNIHRSKTLLRNDTIVAPILLYYNRMVTDINPIFSQVIRFGRFCVFRGGTNYTICLIVH